MRTYLIEVTPGKRQRLSLQDAAKAVNEGGHLLADPYPGAVPVYSTDTAADVSAREEIANRIYWAALDSGNSPEDAEDAVRHAGFAAR